MNTTKFIQDTPGKTGGLQVILIGIIIALLWPLAQRFFAGSDPTAGVIEANIWLLILTALMCWMLLISVCWWLLKKGWLALGLPSIYTMVTHFNTLELWKQLGFYWLSFALLVSAGLLCLLAIC